MDTSDMTYLTPIYDPVYDPIGGDIEPGAPASASFGASEDLARKIAETLGPAK